MGHGGARSGAGRKPKSLEEKSKRKTVKAYPNPEEKLLLEQYAKKANMTLSSYLLHKGLCKK